MKQSVHHSFESSSSESLSVWPLRHPLVPFLGKSCCFGLIAPLVEAYRFIFSSVGRSGAAVITTDLILVDSSLVFEGI